MKRFSTALLASFVALTLAAPSVAHAFDWNGQTIGYQFTIGASATKSGHPLATLNAFRAAIKSAQGDPAAARALLRVLRESRLQDLERNAAASLQAVIFGSWLNEVNTNIDGEGSFSLYMAARFLALRYSAYLDGRTRSENWAPDTGYSSSNYMHSMMVSSTDPTRRITQDDGFEMIQTFTEPKLEAAILQLARATKGREDGSLAQDRADKMWTAGLHSLGNVFHTIEDSSVACTPEAKAALAPRGRTCIVGDGHGVVGTVSTGERRVVALSDNAFYDRKVKEGYSPHSELDSLYTPATIQSVFGAFDPAIADGKLLIGVTTAANEILDATANFPLLNADGSPGTDFEAHAEVIARQMAAQLQQDVIDQRYAAPADRKPLPPVPTSGKADGTEDFDDEADDAAAGCTVATPGGTPDSPGSGLLVLGAVGLVATRRRRRA